MKKFIAILILIALFCIPFAAFSGCEAQNDGRLKVVVTIFSEYDWVMNVLGDRADDVNVTLLLDSGADLHSYNPTGSEILKIAKADLFVYVGGESDSWVPAALQNAVNKSMRTISLLDVLGDAAKEEEAVNDLEGEDEHDHSHEEEGEDHDHVHEEAEYDEHVWLSLSNAKLFVNRIAEELAAIDPEYAETYRTNAATYISSISALDERYKAMVADSSRDTIVVADRFPFRYLVDDYDIKYYAAYVGCSAVSELNMSIVRNLRDHVNALDIRVLLVTENSDKRIAQAVKSESARKDQEILVLDALESASQKEYAAGRTYLSVMGSNLEALQKALR